MRLETLPGRPHLTYCTNIHAGESWTEVHEVVRTHVTEVKARVCPDAPFGVGLRLSARAAEELERPDVLAAFRETLATRELYVFTINGFPYGDFHGTRVKENVYRPDWSEPARSIYTLRLTRLLAELLPSNVSTGSVSTAPLCFRGCAPAKEGIDSMARELVRVAVELSRLEASTGKTIVVALEPEPACLLETTTDAVTFFEERLFRHAGKDEGVARRHLGVCLDACHAAVGRERPEEAVDRLRRAGIAVAKIQLSSAIEARGATARAELARFAEDTYLHQTVVERETGTLEHYVDLPDALREPIEEGAVFLTHFHVPISLARLGGLSGTQAWLRELLGIVRSSFVSEHLEVETYTWDVLPKEHRMPTVVDDIARELAWVKAELA